MDQDSLRSSVDLLAEIGTLLKHGGRACSSDLCPGLDGRASMNTFCYASKLRVTTRQRLPPTGAYPIGRCPV